MTVFKDFEDAKEELAWQIWWDSWQEASGGVTKEIDRKTARHKFEQYLTREYE